MNFSEKDIFADKETDSEAKGHDHDHRATHSLLTLNSKFHTSLPPAPSRNPGSQTEKEELREAICLGIGVRWGGTSATFNLGKCVSLLLNHTGYLFLSFYNL